MMKRPSIDRIDSKGHYTLENCRYMELRDNVKRPYTAHCHKHRRTHRVINDFKGCVFKQPFSNHYSYGKFGMTIHRKSIAITEYGGYEKNDQNKQYIEIPTRYLRQMIKFYLKKGLQPNDPR